MWAAPINSTSYSDWPPKKTNFVLAFWRRGEWVWHISWSICLRFVILIVCWLGVSCVLLNPDFSSAPVTKEFIFNWQYVVAHTTCVFGRPKVVQAGSIQPSLYRLGWIAFSVCILNRTSTQTMHLRSKLTQITQSNVKYLIAYAKIIGWMETPQIIHKPQRRCKMLTRNFHLRVLQPRSVRSLTWSEAAVAWWGPQWWHFLPSF